MVSKRKIDEKNPMRSKVFEYLREHPQELRYIVGDYLAKNGLMAVKIPKFKRGLGKSKKAKWMTKK